MFDARIRGVIDPPLNAGGRVLAGWGVSPNAVTLAGLVTGLAAAISIALGAYAVGLLLILLSRLADGLDGAIARASHPTDFGGFLDILSDFVFYGAIPFAFALADPGANALAAAFLLFSFYANGSAFLAWSILAEKRGLESSAQGVKTLYYVGGILEGAETIGLFVFFCLFPEWFAPAAWAFGAVCFVSAAARGLLAWKVFGRT